jgi:hypothetical protein
VTSARRLVCAVVLAASAACSRMSQTRVVDGAVTDAPPADRPADAKSNTDSAPAGDSSQDSGPTACEHNLTTCTTGFTCTNGCGISCTCKSGFANCGVPTNAAACDPSQTPGCSYDTVPGSTTATAAACVCNAQDGGGATWLCPITKAP